MVTIAEVLKWKIGPVEEAGEFLLNRRSRLLEHQTDIDAGRPPSTWESPHIEAAVRVHQELKLRLNDMVAEVSSVRAALMECGDRMKEARKDLEDALDEASKEGFHVDQHTGTISSDQCYADEAAEDEAKADQQAVKHKIEEALTKATQADADLAKAFLDAAKGADDGGRGSMASAAVQLPPSLAKLGHAAALKELGGEIALDTIDAYLKADAEVGSWKVEGAADAQYKVMADGSVHMVLQLDGGLGREISIGGSKAKATAGVSAGLSSTLDLRFDSPEKAQKFLSGLDDAAFKMKWYEAGAAPEAIAKNVAEYVMKQDVQSFKTGVYGAAHLDIKTSRAEGGAEGRVDGYYDWVKHRYGVKVEATVGGEVEGKGSAEAKVSGDAQFDKDGHLAQMTFSGKFDATVANERLGLNIPHSGTGGGVEAELKVTPENPYWNEIKDAVKGGDMTRAADLAMHHGEAVVKQYSVEEMANEDKDVDIKVAKVDAKYGASEEHTNKVWVRPNDAKHFISFATQGSK